MAEEARRTASHPQPVKKAKRGPIRRLIRGVCILLLLALVISASVVTYAYLTATWASSGRLFTKVADLPVTKVGIVFGTSAKVGKYENPYFRYRIDAAAEVWHANKVETLIVSGDNSTPYYNEPEKMKQALMEKGVPEDRIVCDDAGLRTLDSVVRAKEIFGTKSLLVISQRFQNQRAIYLAQANGIEAFGYNAKDVDFQTGFRTNIREIGARVKMWLDVNFLHTRPRHLGEKIELPE